MDKLTDYLERVQKTIATMSLADFKHSLENLNNCKDEFFKRCAPCKTGDRVMISRDLKIPKDSGWYHCKHFLVVGAKGTVSGVEFFGGQFRPSVIFDEESWIGLDSNVNKTDYPHTFCMGEKDLKVII